MLTAKVFRTHHATMAVRDSLEGSDTQADDPGFLKWETANLANLEAAILCNHTKMAPASWPRSRQRYRERRDKAADRVRIYQERLKTQREALATLRQEAREKRQAAPEAKKQQVKARYQKRIEAAEGRVERTRGMLHRARLSRDKVKAQYSIASKKRTWNLGTSLKSYIDPRVYYEWGQQVDYDVLEKYYPKALRRKFAWVKDGAEGAVPIPDEAPYGREETAQGPGDVQEAHQVERQSQDSLPRRKRTSARDGGARKRYTTWALGLSRTSARRRTRLANP